MALIIAITYSLTDDDNADLNIDTATVKQTTGASGGGGDSTVNTSERPLNASEIFTMLLDTNWPLAGKVLRHSRLLYVF